MNDKPTGNLEELFRHHLADAEVPPRSMLWEQIDNSLLVAQNETYRRRLAATRWVAAASLLLATLAGGGWWAQHEAGTADRMAANRIQMQDQGQIGTLRTAEADGQRLANANRHGMESSMAADVAVATSATAAAVALRLSKEAMMKQSATALAAVSSGLSSTTELNEAGLVARTGPAGASTNVYASRIGGAMAGRLGLGRMTSTSAATAASAAGYAVAASTAGQAAYGNQTIASATDFAGNNSSLGATLATGSNSFDWLNARPVALQKAPLASPLSAALMALALPVETKTTVVPPVRKWQFGVSYAATAFNPNVNFSRVGSDADFDYNPALGANSPKLTEAAATEYREHLQAGLGQRLALQATRRVGGHWAISTGLEVAQQSAKSATSGTFLGEQVPDFGQQRSSELRGTSFSYRTAGIPVELRYSNSVKHGWSGYGRLGAVVSALFTVRGEVDGQPEATRSYSLLSSNDAYRKVLANVRGGAGVQFRPAGGHWAFTLGPTAEVGLMSLNAHPTQDLLHQRRPYGFGLEAGMEFGK